VLVTWEKSQQLWDQVYKCFLWDISNTLFQELTQILPGSCHRLADAIKLGLDFTKMCPELCKMLIKSVSKQP